MNIFRVSVSLNIKIFFLGGGWGGGGRSVSRSIRKCKESFNIRARTFHFPKYVGVEFFYFSSLG